MGKFKTIADKVFKKKDGDTSALDMVASSNNRFAAGIYARMAANQMTPGQGENLFFSPISIACALAMTSMGACGSTASEMLKVMHLDADKQQVQTGFRHLIESLDSPSTFQEDEYVDGMHRQKQAPAFQLCLANALWLQRDYQISKTFAQDVSTCFFGKLSELDFVNAPAESLEIVNDWVAEKTENKIEDLIQPSMINKYTRLILTNAVYFMSNWAEPFSEHMTTDLPFFLPADSAISSELTCPQMYTQGWFGYMETESFKGLSLPYKGNDLEMLIFLPKEVKGLPGLEKQFTGENLSKWREQFSYHEVKVTLPKFKFSSETDLAEMLKGMGMERAFTWPGADFSGILENRKKELVISAVLHKAFIAVDEEGTEAAAATAVMMAAGAAPPEEEPVFKTFTANHPFLFLIHHKKTKAHLFMGRLANPGE